MNSLTDPWPPYCCVPAFVDAALRELGIQGPSRPDLARSLEVRVPDNCANPWSLAIAPDPMSSGITPDSAVGAINRLLDTFEVPSVRMRHVRLRSIALQLYADLANQALRRGVVVGIGLDWATYSREGPGVHRHLLRLKAAGADTVRALDDTLGVDAVPFDVPWEQLERSVHVVDDGFWLIGPTPSLYLDAAGPWSATGAR